MKITRFFPRTLFFAAILSLVLVVPRYALAHAVLIESTPSAHATLKGPQVAVHLKFNSRIDGAHSRLYLVDPNGKMQTLTLSQQDAPDTLSAQSVKLAAGAYTIRWQALASDGHITRGEIAFTVQ
jgi:methionine-rich copper-binding protein CopC